jgi:hypothetical protein|tara:strand:+ start:129 stop:599 length:471 start_codon:yes stop_codon:yes gene_type:complete
MTSRSKRKGDGFEREIAEYLNARLFPGTRRARRAPLSGGGASFGVQNSDSGGGSADILGAPDVWIEAKRTERFTPYAAMEQAERGIKGQEAPEIPVVINRRNRVSTGDALVVMRFDGWLELYEAFLKQRRHIQDDNNAPAEEDQTVHQLPGGEELP